VSVSISDTAVITPVRLEHAGP